MTLACEVGANGFVEHGDESDDVAIGNVIRRLDTIGDILLHCGVSQRDLLLIVQPVLIVGSKTSVENPLAKAEISP